MEPILRPTAFIAGAACVLALALLSPARAAAAEPDQVLVLYNADYRIDQDGSAPGQDSKEVAEYYVRRHTDPATGKKPWMLGLTCVHGKDHLNTYRLPEDSQDNYCGLEYVGFEEPPKDWPVYDSRQCDVVLSKDEAARLDAKSVVIEAGKKADRSDAKTLFRDGEPGKGFVVVTAPSEKDGTLGYRFGPRQAASGIVHAWFDAKDKAGAPLKNIRLVFHDFTDFLVSTTGRDKIRDDRNYVDDVERQVQDFLQNNAAADGTPLRDHILYIVVCHGLPKAVESSYGVGRGSTESLGDMGDGSSLQQRLMLLYYDITDIDFVFTPGPNGMQQTPFTKGMKPRFTKFPRPLLRDGDGVQRLMIANSLNMGLLGQFNPYQHPRVFPFGENGQVPDMLDQAKYADPANRLFPPLYSKDAEPQPHLSPALRKAWPKQCFLYWAMRIDGPMPEIAKAQVDSAIYGTRYLTPKMGTCYNRLAGPSPIRPSVRLGIDELKDLGFTLQPKLNDPPKVVERPLIFSAYFGDGPRYLDEGEIAGQNGVLPGGIVYAVKSLNRWSQHDNQFGAYFQKMVEAGATLTAGLGATGGAHITSASWWDDRILFHHLFRGYQLGESLMMSTYYLDWVIAYVGDPLYRPNVLENKPDAAPPVLDGEIAAELLPARDSYCAVLRATLKQTPQNPEMAEMAVLYETRGHGDTGTRGRGDAGTGGAAEGLSAKHNPSDPSTAWCWRFSARPQVVLRNLKPGATYDYTATLTDAYGNATRVKGSVEVPAAAPSRLRHQETVADGKKATPISIAKAWKKDEPPAFTADAGEIDIEFTPHKDKFRIVELNGLVWNSDQLKVGSGTALTHEPLKFEPGKRYRLAARWRRHPVTREVYLIADGKEYLAACNNCVPWGVKEEGEKKDAETRGRGDTGTGGKEDAASAISNPSDPSDPSKTREPVFGETRFGDRDGDITIHSVKIFDNANPAPDEHTHPYVARFQMK